MMGITVVPNEMPLLIYFSKQVLVALYPFANTEKSRFYSVIFQDFQDFWCGFRIRPVIKTNGNDLILRFCGTENRYIKTRANRIAAIEKRQGIEQQRYDVKECGKGGIAVYQRHANQRYCKNDIRISEIQHAEIKNKE